MHTRTYGFRLSVSDVAFIIIGSGLTYYLWPRIGKQALIIPFVIAHFFLFCNIFRVRRKPELIWAGVFLVNAGSWHLSGDLNLYWVFGAQLLLTAIIILNEFRCPRYHGVFATKINPHLDQYLSGEIP